MKWTESRSEGNMAVHHGRDQIHGSSRSPPTARRRGSAGLKVDLLADMGAYLQLVTPGVPLLGAFMYSGIYKMDAYDFTCTGVFTTKTPTDAYRGAGRPEATFAIERIMDELAAELGMEPMELRRRNWITHEEFPYTTICGLTYDSGNYEAATARAMELFDYDGLRGRAGRAARPRATRSSSASASRRSPRCAGWRPSRMLGSLKLRRGRLGARHGPGAADRQGRGGHRHQRRTARATRRPGARSPPTRWACRSTDIEVIHGDTAVSPTAWTPTARAPWRSAAWPYWPPARRWWTRPG